MRPHDETTGHGHGHQHDDLGDHTGYETGTERIQVLERIFDENDHTAAANRADFDRAGVTVLNLMSGPGAGKTTLLRQMLEKLRLGVIETSARTGQGITEWCSWLSAAHHDHHPAPTSQFL